MPKGNKVKEEEKQAEQAAEAAEVPAETTADSTTDEEAVKAGEVEKEVGAEEAMPAEVAAINTDNETATSASEASADTPEPKGVKTAKPFDAAQGKPVPRGKYADIIAQIESLKVTELAELVKALEQRFGVSAAVPVAGGGPSTSPGSAGPASAEEKTTYAVVLVDGGAQKIAVIKAVREIRQDLGLKEAKDLVEGAPKELLKDAKKEAAEAAKAKLEAAGAKVELR